MKSEQLKIESEISKVDQLEKSLLVHFFPNKSEVSADICKSNVRKNKIFYSFFPFL